MFVRTRSPPALCLLSVSDALPDTHLVCLPLPVNVGILGATGYITYSKWNRWDSRTFATLAAGLASFGLGESYLVSHI